MPRAARAKQVAGTAPRLLPPSGLDSAAAAFPRLMD